MPTEADTCRKFVVLKLQASGWETEPHSILEQRPITDGLRNKGRAIPARDLETARSRMTDWLQRHPT